ncbi:hypothetical protein GCM10027273_19220 [Nocardioides pakistanensis]
MTEGPREVGRYDPCIEDLRPHSTSSVRPRIDMSGQTVEQGRGWMEMLTVLAFACGGGAVIAGIGWATWGRWTQV